MWNSTYSPKFQLLYVEFPKSRLALCRIQHAVCIKKHWPRHKSVHKSYLQCSKRSGNIINRKITFFYIEAILPKNLSSEKILFFLTRKKIEIFLRQKSKNFRVQNLKCKKSQISGFDHFGRIFFGAKILHTGKYHTKKHWSRPILKSLPETHHLASEQPRLRLEPLGSQSVSWAWHVPTGARCHTLGGST